MGLYVVMMVAGSAEEAGGARKANRLIQEKSPYLLQHAYNPVDWYPWGEEAFEKARKEKKPILLSVGYSTCHWCHVMERESFEDEKVAEFMNAHFVCIKLDREERPDVDRVYMQAFQAMSSEGGGWPLNMFLTPELKPFFGGTYFPPKRRGGRPGFLEVLTHLEGMWREKRDEIRGSAEESLQRMKTYLQEEQARSRDGVLTRELVGKAAKQLLTNGDEREGGWGGGPKFPQPSHLRFLLRCGDRAERDFALLTCRKMMRGGIYDHLGGGFHRYAVDGVWLVPHFEKMLYDQAQLVDVYVDAWLLSGEAAFKRVAMETADAVLRDMLDAEGGFFSALDAQSEGKEGKNYCWTEEELKNLLTKGEFKILQRYFGITTKGNFLDHSDPAPLLNQNVLHVAEPEWKRSAPEEATLQAALGKMRELRAKRIPPATDDKILASWNGLMIGALARAGRVLGEDRYLAAAEKAHRFVVAKLWDSEAKTLYHRWRDGARDSSQQAESYLYFLRGTRRLYETTLKEEYLELAVELAEGTVKRFYDEKGGGFYDGEDRKDLVLRLKGDFDSATPTASSVGAVEFAKLGEMTGRQDFRKVADHTMNGSAAGMKSSPFAVVEMLRAVDFKTGKPSRLVVAGENGREAMLKAAWKGFRRNLVVIGNVGPVDAFSRGLKATGEGVATAYLCVGQTCRLPETNPAKVAVLLEEGGQ